jgi:DUF1009 family protein
LQERGITLLDSTTYTTDQLAIAGVMTRQQPTEAQWIDIRHGWEICQQVSRMDIGQSIALLNRDVLAVEALEGTNAMIERAGTLCKVGGWTLIKVANKQQDMRMDVPTIRDDTMARQPALHRADSDGREKHRTWLVKRSRSRGDASAGCRWTVAHLAALPERVSNDHRAPQAGGHE